MANDIVEISAMQRKIATAIVTADADTLMDLRSICEGAVKILAARGHNLVKANEFARAKIDCEAALGEMLAQTTLSSGGRPSLNQSPRGTSLAEIGVNKNQSSRWQLIANHVEILPAAVDALMEKDEQITTKGVVRELKRLLAETNMPAPLEIPEGQYSVVVIDPPWDMKKIDREVRELQAAFDYPTMSVDDIARMKLPAADDCHLFMWTTQRFLWDAPAIFEAWNFRKHGVMVWHKPGGFQPVGLFQYNVEFVVYGRRGSPKFIDTKDFKAGFTAPRREHSRKPDEFYDTIRRVTEGPRIDMFSREAREGFESWGNEADKFTTIEE